MAYSAKKWAQVRADYETGDYSSVKLGQKHGIPKKSIEYRMSKEKWEKGKTAPIIQEITTKITIEKYAEMGMPLERLMQITMKLAEAKNPLIAEKGIAHLERQCGLLAPEKRQIQDDRSEMTYERAQEILRKRKAERDGTGNN